MWAYGRAYGRATMRCIYIYLRCWCFGHISAGNPPAVDAPEKYLARGGDAARTDQCGQVAEGGTDTFAVTACTAPRAPQRHIVHGTQGRRPTPDASSAQHPWGTASTSRLAHTVYKPPYIIYRTAHRCGTNSVATSHTQSRLTRPAELKPCQRPLQRTGRGYAPPKEHCLAAPPRLPPPPPPGRRRYTALSCHAIKYP
jgi:hypothetical protein